MSLGDPGSPFENLYVTDAYFAALRRRTPTRTSLTRSSACCPARCRTIPTTPLPRASGSLTCSTACGSRGRCCWGCASWRSSPPWAFLLCQAGRRPGKEGVTLRWVDRIPLDVMAVGAFLAVMMLSGLVGELFYAISYNYRYSDNFQTGLSLAGSTVIFVCASLLILAFLCTLATRVKAGKWWKTFLLVRLTLWIFRQLGRACRWVAQGFRAIALAPRAALGAAAALFAEFVLIFLFLTSYDRTVPLFLLFLFNLTLFVAIVLGARQLVALRKAGERLAAGDLTYHLNTDKLYWDFKRHGENLKRHRPGHQPGRGAADEIGTAENRADYQRLPRHQDAPDVHRQLCGPAAKAHSDQEGAQYLEVLDRQAKRLKKLTEDLVEASKASTGNLPVSLAPTSVDELVSQAVEEYRDRLEQRKLEVVVYALSQSSRSSGADGPGRRQAPVAGAGQPPGQRREVRPPRHPGLRDGPHPGPAGGHRREEHLPGAAEHRRRRAVERFVRG